MNCKRGDLAFVVFVGHVSKQANVGRVVRVVRRNGTSYYEGYGELPCWWIRSEGSAMVSNKGLKSEGNMPDIALRPIRGEPERKAVEKPEEITA